MKQFLLAAGWLGLFLLTPAARAHYLWLGVDPGPGDKGTVDLYFEEGPAPGDGRYLDPFVEEGKTWVRTPGEKAPTPLKLAEVKKGAKRWLAAPLPEAAPRGIDSYGKFGVYRYGKTDVLLHYYARHLDVRTPKELASLGRAKHLALELIPEWNDGSLHVQVIWQGKPLPGRPVVVRGPRGFRRNLTTDERGSISFRPDAAGAYTLRTYAEVDKKGTDQGKDYHLIRHHGTMNVTLPLKAGEKE